MHVIGNLFPCKGAARNDPEYNGMMLTKGDMRKMIDRFYLDKASRNGAPIPVNEEHRTKCNDIIGRVENIWSDERDHMLKVHVALNASSVGGMRTMKRLRSGEALGLSLEMSADKVNRGRGDIVIRDKALVGVAVTATPSHDVWISDYAPDPATLLRRHFGGDDDDDDDGGGRGDGEAGDFISGDATDNKPCCFDGGRVLYGEHTFLRAIHEARRQGNTTRTANETNNEEKAKNEEKTKNEVTEGAAETEGAEGAEAPYVSGRTDATSDGGYPSDDCNVRPAKPRGSTSQMSTQETDSGDALRSSANAAAAAAAATSASDDGGEKEPAADDEDTVKTETTGVKGTARDNGGDGDIEAGDTDAHAKGEEKTNATDKGATLNRKAVDASTDGTTEKTSDVATGEGERGTTEKGTTVAREEGEEKGEGKERREQKKGEGKERNEEKKGEGKERSEEKKGEGKERSEEKKGEGKERREEKKGEGKERSEEKKGEGKERSEEKKNASSHTSESDTKDAPEMNQKKTKPKRARDASRERTTEAEGEADGRRRKSARTIASASPSSSSSPPPRTRRSPPDDDRQPVRSADGTDIGRGTSFSNTHSSMSATGQAGNMDGARSENVDMQQEARQEDVNVSDGRATSRDEWTSEETGDIASNRNKKRPRTAADIDVDDGDGDDGDDNTNAATTSNVASRREGGGRGDDNYEVTEADELQSLGQLRDHIGEYMRTASLANGNDPKQMRQHIQGDANAKRRQLSAQMQLLDKILDQERRNDSEDRLSEDMLEKVRSMASHKDPEFAGVVMALASRGLGDHRMLESNLNAERAREQEAARRERSKNIFNEGSRLLRRHSASPSPVPRHMKRPRAGAYAGPPGRDDQSVPPKIARGHTPATHSSASVKSGVTSAISRYGRPVDMAGKLPLGFYCDDTGHRISPIAPDIVNTTRLVRGPGGSVISVADNNSSALTPMSQMLANRVTGEFKNHLNRNASATRDISSDMVNLQLG